MVFSRLSFRRIVLTSAAVLYVVGVWLHYPYGGGHIYSDIPDVFISRECAGGCMTLPYVNGFIEYPIIVSLFIYVMGRVGLALPISGSVFGPYFTQNSYYLASVAVLAIPSILLVDETLKMAGLLDVDKRRVLKYLVITPTFVFLLLVNWYSIGVWLMLLGLRRFLEGKKTSSAILFGLSAASNMITASPAVGLMFGSRTLREAAGFAGTALLTFFALNAPFILVNPHLWGSYWQYQSNWYIEDSWMRFFLTAYSPLRHVVSIVSAVVLLGSVLFVARRRSREPVSLACLSAFAVLFSSYVFTPQMNLMILPFLTLMPIVTRYWEFLVFDILAAAIIIVGFSEPLQIIGITYSVANPLYAGSPIILIAILRSAWLGKFLLWNGIRKAILR